MAGQQVVAVHASTSRSFSKFAEEAVTLLEDLGVQGDAHAGATVQHRSRVARDPSQPNLRHPCSQIDRFQKGSPRRCSIGIELPAAPHRRLEPV